MEEVILLLKTHLSADFHTWTGNKLGTQMWTVQLGSSTLTGKQQSDWLSAWV